MKAILRFDLSDPDDVEKFLHANGGEDYYGALCLFRDNLLLMINLTNDEQEANVCRRVLDELHEVIEHYGVNLDA